MAGRTDPEIWVRILRPRYVGQGDAEQVLVMHSTRVTCSALLCIQTASPSSTLLITDKF